MAYVSTDMHIRIGTCLIALGMSRECCSFSRGHPPHQRPESDDVQRGDQIT